MRRFDGARRRPRRGIAVLLTALPLIASVTAEELPIRKLRIDSQPAGAEVSAIGGTLGYTPLTISERVIYPNRYPKSLDDLYGKVVLRRAGCVTREHRVTLDDIEQGLNLALDCAPQTAARSDQDEYGTTGGGPAAERVQSAAQTASASVSERRLRQLQVLQELLDEGLIAASEEQRIRRRLLERP